MAQKETSVTGITIDAVTGDTLPFVQIMFEGSTIGTTSDWDGRFTLSNYKGFSTLSFRNLGYKTLTVNLRQGHVNKLGAVKLEPEAYKLEDVVVKPQKQHERYRRKGNPAVDLIKKTIANKNRNRVEWEDSYKVDAYEKLVMALDPFDYNLDKNSFWQKFKFLENYLDTMQVERGVLVVDSGKIVVDSMEIGLDSTLVNVDSVVLKKDEKVLAANQTKILTISLRETMAEEYYQRTPRRDRTVIKAKRWEGLDELFDNGGMSSNLQAMFQPINIFNNDINVMLNHFVSPLSSSLAVSYYHYYIMDTVMIENEPCVDLAFVPVNSESFGFTGHLYITTDSTCALKKYKINVPPNINLNWVSHLSIEQTFQKLPSGLWAPEEVNTHTRFAITKKSKHNIYARQTRHFSNYEFNASIPDSLFYMSGSTVEQPNAAGYTKAEWDDMRPIALNGKETMVDSLETELMRVPAFRGIVNTVEDLIQEFIPTTATRNASKWDFGPIFNTFSYNEQEGCRLRIGGMTTANQNKHWYTSEYVAYGFNDQRVKGGITALYSFNEHPYHPYETLRHYLSLSMSYDLEELGQTYRVLDRDHIFMSIKFNYKPMPMQYIGKIRLKYEKEYANQFSIITWADFMHNQPNGSSMDFNYGKMRLDREHNPLLLKYNKITSLGENGEVLATQETPYYHDAMWTFQLRYSPGGYIYNDRQGIESPFNLWKDAPVFRFTNEMGYIIEDKYFYDRIQLTAEKRFWLSAFGHLDLSCDFGYLISKKTPYTKLFIPTSNTSILLDPKAFNLMQPMEFLMDRYAALHVTYYLKGWIFNRIPGIKHLKLREVVSFHMLAGYLGDRNNPYKTEGLYEFPVSHVVTGDNGQAQYVQAKTTFADYHSNGELRYSYMPYMEVTAGIENIFKLIRIEYVRRITHIYAPETGAKLGPWQRNGIRITLRVAM